MAIKVEFEVFEGLLKAIATGSDDDLQDVLNYNEAVLKKALETNTKRVLCDERNLEYKIGKIDTFQAAEYVSEKVPSVSKIAIVYNPSQKEDAEFWETAAVNRWLSVKIFEDIDEAEKWLTGKS